MHWIRKALMAFHERRMDKLSKRKEVEMIARGGVVR